MNTHINKKEKKKISREFLGTIITSKNYRDILEKGGRHEINFHKRHLLAYKRGEEFFNYGFDNENKPILRKTKYSLKEK